MILGNFFITNHACEQYKKRVLTNCDIKNLNVKRNINKDLRTLNIKHIIRTTEKGKKKINIFTKNYKQFIFKKTKSNLILVTIIHRNYIETQKEIEKLKKVETFFPTN